MTLGDDHRELHRACERLIIITASAAGHLQQSFPVLSDRLFQAAQDVAALLTREAFNVRVVPPLHIDSPDPHV
jgi:archaellum component FlaG (FlaF/FlaG flagellin family)